MLFCHRLLQKNVTESETGNMNLNSSEIPLPELVDQLHSFIEHRKVENEKVKRFINSCLAVEIKKITHVWKGVSAPYGFGELADMASLLSDYADSQNFTMCQSVSENIKEYLDKKELDFRELGFI